MREPRILFTTPYCSDYYDYFRENSSPNVDRVLYPRVNSYGLRFIKQNLPEIQILEYPTWDQYAEIVSGNWDVVGFSFFTPDYPKVEKMANFARQLGIPQLWGGFYGSLIPQANVLLDRTFIGYAERNIAEILGQRITDIVHPPIIDAIGVTTQIYFARTGVLFTSRGCPFKCTFCQTPVFCEGKRELLSVASIRRVLSYYKSIHVPLVLILDETFGLAKDHTRTIVEILRDYNLAWMPMTRVDILNKNLDFWMECGLAGAMLGIENMQQNTIQEIRKEIKLKTALRVIDRLVMSGRLVVGFYMIGFENETATSIKEDIHAVSNLGLDLIQVCVVTPLHATPLWGHIEKTYGGIDPNLSNHTTKKLVWNHPTISKNEMAELLASAYEELYPHYQLEYSQSKYFNPHQLSLDSVITLEELSVVPRFDGDEVITEARLSPSRLVSDLI